MPSPVEETFALLRPAGEKSLPHPRIKYGASSNPLPQEKEPEPLRFHLVPHSAPSPARERAGVRVNLYRASLLMRARQSYAKLSVEGEGTFPFPLELRKGLVVGSLSHPFQRGIFTVFPARRRYPGNIGQGEISLNVQYRHARVKQRMHRCLLRY